MNKYFILLCVLLVASFASRANEVDSIPDLHNGLSLDLPDTPMVSITDNLVKISGVSKYGFYTPVRELSFAGVPFVTGGFVAKANNEDFRKARTDLEPDYHHTIDNMTQFAPVVATWGLKALGVEGRSGWARLAVSNALSYITMAAFVNGIKYTTKELRPDGSKANSFPSGHTATAFAAATVLHKEYGLTRSPWYSVAGYTVATATGVMRALNNRHWISDIMVGAGIGIISTDLGYLFTDLIFKDKDILRTDMQGLSDIRRYPSFFSVGLGSKHPFGKLAIGENVLETARNAVPQGSSVNIDNLMLPTLKLGSTLSVSAEGAYFFNPYIGVGGHLEVCAMPVLADNLNVYHVDVLTPDGSAVIPNPAELLGGLQNDTEMKRYFNPDNQYRYSLYPGCNMMQSVDNLPVFVMQLGAFGQLPLSRRCSFGAKMLVGRQLCGYCDLDSYRGILPEEYFDDINMVTGYEPDQIDFNQTMFSIAYETIDLDVKDSFSFTAGISFSALLRQNMGCKVYVDYTNSKFDYTVNYARVNSALMINPYGDGREQIDKGVMAASSSHKHSLQTLSAGISLQLNF
ncbi:MAG: phosphatase PAP2 family protein [Bacteroidales bacterium]|nr:phosphatase PAP2 family protein [Candidatus Sodaliphilus aphodohippi]